MMAPSTSEPTVPSVHGWAALFSCGLIVALLAHSTIAAESPDFERDIAPLLIRHCLECHNDSAETGGLSLTSHDRLLGGGDSGPVINDDLPVDSPLLQRVLAGEMPPPKDDEPPSITPEEIDLLKQWVTAGVSWPVGRVLDPYERTTDARAGRDWWSLQPIVRPEIPIVDPSTPNVNPIDAFIRRSLIERDWQPSPPADRRTLLRRVTYDLIGLPPTFDEFAAFEQDTSPNAYERVVDRLLASPHLGERWGRYWLDLVRYADTCGYERDQEKTGAWKYRDWVIAALNEDMPYDRFVLAQLAGDELPERDESTVIATGFLRLGTWNDEPNDPQEYKYERLEDMVHATSTAFLGLTVKCARCHDHKFDPIPQADYYRMASAFWAGHIEPRDRAHLGGPSADELGFNVFGWTDRGRDVPPLHLLKNGDPKHPGPVVEPGQLTTVSLLDTPITPPPEDAVTTHRRLQLARWITDPRNPLTARVLVNRLWQHHFGHGLVRTPNNFGFNGDRPSHPDLLDWLADELIHPKFRSLTVEASQSSTSRARQEAEREKTQSWTLKRLHKLIVMSETYRQSSNHPQHDEYEADDPGNHMWWRSERRRLDADALRDSLLVASGQLDLTSGGPGFKPTIDSEALEGLSKKQGAWQASPLEEQRRRSIYTYLQRSLLPPLLTVFDQQDTTLPCGQRNVTTVAPQALALMNNSFVHEQSLTLARHIAEMTTSLEDQASLAWRRALHRPPTPTELQAAVAHLRQQTASFRDTQHREELKVQPSVVEAGLVLWLTADVGVERDDAGRVTRWIDQSAAAHDASQTELAARPIWVDAAINGQSAIRFDGRQQWFDIANQVLTSQQYTLLAVATDTGELGHRELFSNWNGPAGNSTSSVFLGLTGEATVRFSDAFSNAGTVLTPTEPFVLSAVNGPSEAVVLQNGLQQGTQSSLPKRDLTTSYVIGQQGNINGEYWHGEIAALLAYDRELSSDERQQVERWLMNKYGIEQSSGEADDPALLALASLCHVLLNTNEFLYVD